MSRRGPKKFVPPKTIHEGWAARIRIQLASPATRTEAAVEVGDWARDLCLLMGASIDTAYHVGRLLAVGIDASWREKREDD